MGATGAPTLLQWNPPNAANSGAGSYISATTGPTSMPGAPNKYQYGSSGVYSITRNSAGKYTIALQDSYTRLVGANAMIVVTVGGATEVTPNMVVVNTTNVTSGTAPQIVVQFQSGSGGAADLTSGDQVLLEFQLQNSAAFG